MPKRNGDKPPTREESVIAFAKVQDAMGHMNQHPFDSKGDPFWTKQSLVFNQEHAYRINHDEGLTELYKSKGYYWNPTKDKISGKVTWQITREFSHNHEKRFDELMKTPEGKKTLMKLFRDGSRVNVRKPMKLEMEKLMRTVKQTDKQKAMAKANDAEALRIAANGIVSMCQDGLIPNNPATDKPWTFVEATENLQAMEKKKALAMSNDESE